MEHEGAAEPPARPSAATPIHDPRRLRAQVSPSWVYKAEWNGTISRSALRRGALGRFRLLRPALRNSDEDYFWRDTTLLVLTGAHAERRPIATASSTPARPPTSSTPMGSHTFKFGGEIYNGDAVERPTAATSIAHLHQRRRRARCLRRADRDRVAAARPATTACCVVNKLDQQDFFVNDTWSKGRVTMNLGLRWDRYRGWMPEQRSRRSATVRSASRRRRSPARENSTRGTTRSAHRPPTTCRRRQDRDQGQLRLFWHNPGVIADAQSATRTTRASPTPGRIATATASTSWVRSRRTRPRRRWPERSSRRRTSPRRTRTTRRSISNGRSAASARASASSTRKTN